MVVVVVVVVVVVAVAGIGPAPFRLQTSGPTRIQPAMGSAMGSCMGLAPSTRPSSGSSSLGSGSTFTFAPQGTDSHSEASRVSREWACPICGHVMKAYRVSCPSCHTQMVVSESGAANTWPLAAHAPKTRSWALNIGWARKRARTR